MKIATLQGRVVKTFVEVPGDEEDQFELVEVHYRPGSLTLEVADEIGKIGEAGSDRADLDVLLVLLEPLLVYWDLEEDILGENGEPTGEVRKLTTSNADIKKVPLPFLGLVLDKITQESRPNPTMAETSGGSLQPEASQAESQSGTTSSPSPSTSESPPGSLSIVP